jgi:glyoxylase-like metal-dependent hydrolase (beta-lactamase superfamily II)/rhodanese-related sulfurtransferase
MAFRQLFDPASCTYTYLIADDATHEAVLIDPVIEQLDRDLQLLRENGLRLKWTLETHVHADHVTAALALKQATGAMTAVAQDCHAQGYDRPLLHNDVVLFGHEELMVIASPGHTPGSVCYLWRDRLFTGDTLLIGGCGRTDFQNGSAGALYDSVTRRIFTLDDQTLVYPAHDYNGRRVSSVGEEKRFNPRFAGRSRDEFVQLMDALDLPKPKRIQEAVPANLAGGTGARVPQDAAAAGARSPASADPTQVRSISALQFADFARSANLRLIDVRTPSEFAQARIAGSVNIPFEALDPAALRVRFGADEPVYCVCQTGTRSQIAAERLRSAGFRRVVHFDGGTNAWRAAGLPLIGGGGAMSLERQVRLTAGVLVIASVAAGALLGWAGYAIAALIGVGLTVSGLTDLCAARLLLSKMPWNRGIAQAQHGQEAVPERLPHTAPR